MKQHSRLDRAPSAWTGSLYCLFYYLCGGSYFPFLYVHFADIGLSGEQIGLLSALPPIVAVVFSPVVATIADRKRIRVRVSQAGLACLAGGVALGAARGGRPRSAAA